MEKILAVVDNQCFGKNFQNFLENVILKKEKYSHK